MAEIRKVLGNRDTIFFQMNDGSMIIGAGEFKGHFDGFFVYRDTLKYRSSGVYLSSEEINELMAAYERHRIAGNSNFVIEWIMWNSD